MTQFINNNSAACPDLIPTAPFATAPADGQPGLHLSYGWATNPGYVAIRANGTALNPTALKNGDFIGVYGTGGYNGGGPNYGYTLGSGGMAIWADEDWSPSGSATYISLDTRSRGVPGDIPALHRIHITSQGITINDANGLEPTGGRLGAGTLNVAGAIAQNGAAILTGPNSFSPTDASVAALVFTAVSVNWYQIGNLVHVYGTLTYPVTGSGAGAKISLPVAVPNQNYARSPSAAFGPVAGLTLRALQNQSVAAFEAAGAAVTNATLSGALINFMLIYPAV